MPNNKVFFIIIIFLFLSYCTANFSSLYKFPYPAGMAYFVSQGNGGKWSHKPGSNSEFAWDFAMPEHSIIIASRAEVVKCVN